MHHTPKTSFLFSFRTVVKIYKLPRGYVRERSYISLPEVRLLIEECLKLTTEGGRAARIKLIVIILFTFFFLFRPGTLGPSHKEYLEQELVRLSSWSDSFSNENHCQYPTLGDIR